MRETRKMWHKMNNKYLHFRKKLNAKMERFYTSTFFSEMSMPLKTCIYDVISCRNYSLPYTSTEAAPNSPRHSLRIFFTKSWIIKSNFIQSSIAKCINLQNVMPW